MADGEPRDRKLFWTEVAVAVLLGLTARTSLQDTACTPISS